MLGRELTGIQVNLDDDIVHADPVAYETDRQRNAVEAGIGQFTPPANFTRRKRQIEQFFVVL